MLHFLNYVKISAQFFKVVSLTGSLVDDSLSLTVFTKSVAVIYFAENCKELLKFEIASHFSRKNGRDFAFKILTSR